MDHFTITQQTREVVNTFFKAMAAQDNETLVGLFHEQPDWFIPGNEALAPWVGRRNNHAEIRAFFELFQRSVKPITVEIEHILADGDFAVATGTFASEMVATGKVYPSIFSIHFTVKNGVIVKYRLQEDSYGLVVALTD